MRQLLPTPSPAPDLYDVYGRDWLEPGGVRVNFVASLDGAVAVNGVSALLQTPGDHAVFAVLRDLADVVLVGRGTVTAEGYRPLTPSPRRAAVRREFGLATDLPLAIVSGRLDLDPGGAVFDVARGAPRTIVVTCAQAPTDRLARLRARADVVVAGDAAVDLPEARSQLEERGLRRILSEGGPGLLAGMLAASVVDELCLTVSPLLAGPGAGRIVAGTPLASPLGGRIVSLLEEDDALFYRFAVDRTV